MAYANTLPAAEKIRYLLKLQVLYNSDDPEVAIDPYQIDDGKWKDDITLWPQVEFGNQSLEEWLDVTILSAASHGSTTNVLVLSVLLEENGTALIVERSIEHSY